MKVKNKIHLSFDMDYWNGNLALFSRDFKQILYIIKRYNIPYKYFENHHEILNFLNSRKISSVINVDFHSDIAEDDKWYNKRYSGKIELNCGTWGNFVKKSIKLNGSYLWVHPHERYDRMLEVALCHSTIDPFLVKATHWKSVLKKRIDLKYIVAFLDDIWENVDSVSIVSSPDYTSDDIFEHGIKLLSGFGIMC